MITDRQKDYILALLDKKDITSLSVQQEVFLEDRANLDRLSKDKASTVIQLLIKCNDKVKLAAVEVSEKVDDDNVSAGRYFIVDPTDNVEKFFKVDKPDDGKWKGYTFLHVQASDDFYPIKDKAHREAVIAEIAKDPVTAMNEYGIRLGRCGKCGRTLTHIDSRLRGLGPVCAGRMRKFYQIELSADDIQNLLKGEEDE